MGSDGMITDRGLVATRGTHIVALIVRPYLSIPDPLYGFHSP